MVIHAVSQTIFFPVFCFLTGCKESVISPVKLAKLGVTQSALYTVVVLWSTASFHMPKMSDIHGFLKCCFEACPWSHIR